MLIYFSAALLARHDRLCLSVTTVLHLSVGSCYMEQFLKVPDTI